MTATAKKKSVKRSAAAVQAGGEEWVYVAEITDHFIIPNSEDQAFHWLPKQDEIIFF
jgi:microcompartment protein CcmL/EutN